MKGGIGVCLLLFLACNNVRMATGVEVAEGDRPKPKLVLKKDDTSVTTLLNCKVNNTSTFTTFEWKISNGGEANVICSSDGYGNPCKIKDDFTAAYQISDEKYNLDVFSGNPITYGYSGKYSCVITMPTSLETPEQYDSDVTVAHLPVCSDGSEVTIAKGSTKDITCEQTYTGSVPTTLEYFKGSDNTGAKDTEADTGTGRKLTYRVPTDTEGSVEYVCKARAEGDADYKGHTCNSKVKVVASPIATKPADMVARIGEKNVKMTCTVAEGATGYGTFLWTKEKALICVGKETGDPEPCQGFNKDNYNLDAEAKHDLNIKEVKEALAGEHTCVVQTTNESYKASLIPITATSPNCSKSDKKLICKVTYKGETPPPTVQWHKDDVDTKVTSASKDGVLTVEVEPADGEDDKYACRVMNGGVKAYECKVDSGAPSFDARIYHSALFSVVVVWLWHQFN